MIALFPATIFISALDLSLIFLWLDPVIDKQRAPECDCPVRQSIHHDLVLQLQQSLLVLRLQLQSLRLAIRA
jgi:hypothetical protein